MLVKCMPVGNLEANCYVVTDEATLECAVIDPGDESNVILDYIESNRLRPRAILLTHGHFDHTGAVAEVASQTGEPPVYICREDAAEPGSRELYKYVAPEGTRYYGDGDTVEAGPLRFRVYGTPGHSPGSVTLRCGEALFTGDTLFRGSCGRTDLPGGDLTALQASLKKLAELPGDFEIWPGHLDPTTMSVERKNNYYMRYALGE